MKEKLLSIIVPVYNVKCYLPECIESVTADRSDDVEFILIDDGSTDGSGILCDIYASRDSRIKVIHKLNEGVSVARNTGIEHSCGKWVWFIDADDYIKRDSIQFLRKYLFSEYDTIISGIYIFNGEMTEYPVSEMLSKKKESLLMHVNCYQNGMILFSNDVIAQFNLRFTKGLKMGEDLEFQCRYFIHCRNIITTGKSLYVWRFRSGSAMNNALSDYNNMIDNLAISRNFIEYLRDNNISSSDWLVVRIRNFVKSVLVSASKINKSKRIHLHREIVRIMDGYRHIGFVGIEDATLKLARMSLSLYFILLKVYLLVQRLHKVKK